VDCLSSYVYNAQNRRVAKYYIYYEEPPEAMLRDREAKLYCAAGARSAGFSLLAGAWTRGEGVNPYVGAPVRESSAGVPPASPAKLPFPSARMAGKMPTLLLGEECRGGADWLDERATEALLTRAGVLCHDPQYPVYEKQTFAYDGWRVIQEHKKAAYGTGIPLATAIPVARQFAYGNYLDEALTVDADTDSDGDCIDSGGSTRYYYHQNSLFNVVALSDASANYKEGYQYDPYGRHVRITDGNDGDTYVNFNTNDARSALATSNYGNPYLFTGQRLDSESGLYYYKMRYYSTSQGRFISRDPIGSGVDKRNRGNGYSYVGNSPLANLDPKGLRMSKALCESGVAFALGVDPLVKKMMAIQEGMGCFPEIRCKCCNRSDDAGGITHPYSAHWSLEKAHPKIDICLDGGGSNVTDIRIIVAHELRHSYDACMVPLRRPKFPGDVCEDVACQEIRAASMDGACCIGGPARGKGESFDECVKRSAAWSTASSGACPRPFSPQRAVEDMYAKCSLPNRATCVYIPTWTLPLPTPSGSGGAGSEGTEGGLQ